MFLDVQGQHTNNPVCHEGRIEELQFSMRKASVSDLHTRTSELVRQAAAGAVIVIERRGEPVAELRPIAKRKKKLRHPDMTAFWASMPKLPGDSTDFISEDRDRCT
jgi:prevent-host-death family protein